MEQAISRITGLVAGTATAIITATPGFSQVYRTPDNTVFVPGRPAGETITGNYSKSRVLSIRAGACGELVVRNVAFEFMVGNTTYNTFEFPLQLMPPCINGQFVEARTEPFRVDDSRVVIPGLAAGQFYEVRVNADRRVRADQCGVATFRPTKTYLHGNTDLVSLVPGGLGYWQRIEEFPVRSLPLCRTVEGEPRLYLQSDWPEAQPNTGSNQGPF